MISIDWSKSPSWALYVAKDSNGEWYWFQHRPKYITQKGKWIDKGSGLISRVVEEYSKSSLQSRPGLDSLTVSPDQETEQT